MRYKRTKYKRTVPRSQVEFSDVEISLGDGIDRLLSAVAKLIEKYLGLLYMNGFITCSYRADDNY